MLDLKKKKKTNRICARTAYASEWRKQIFNFPSFKINSMINMNAERGSMDSDRFEYIDSIYEYLKIKAVIP